MEARSCHCCLQHETASSGTGRMEWPSQSPHWAAPHPGTCGCMAGSDPSLMGHSGTSSASWAARPSETLQELHQVLHKPWASWLVRLPSASCKEQPAVIYKVKSSASRSIVQNHSVTGQACEQHIAAYCDFNFLFLSMPCSDPWPEGSSPSEANQGNANTISPWMDTVGEDKPGRNRCFR